MFEVLIREAAARFGLGDKALALIQMLLAYMTGKETGGLAGFLDKFKSAGLGPVVQSWLGGGPAAQPVSNSQLETVLGVSGGLLPLLSARLDLPRDNITTALGYLLPTLVGKLTPGGNTPASLPPEIAALAATGQGLLSAAPTASPSEGAAGGGLSKSLPWIIVVVLLLIGLAYWANNRGGSTAPPMPPQAKPVLDMPAAPKGSPSSPAVAASQEAPAAMASQAPAAAASQTPAVSEAASAASEPAQ